MAVACWGVAWVLALVAMVVSMRRVLPPGIWRTPPTGQASTWLAEARPFWYYRISLALVAQAAIIALDGLQPSATAVGAYVAAIATANLPLVLVTSTHRHYARRLSILLERRDFAGVLDLRRERLQWLVPLAVLFLAAVFGFGREILGVFRPEFVDEGLAALRVLAIATATSMLFALAPTYLKYAGHNRATLGTVAGAAVIQIILLLVLVPGFAALGAAIASSVPILGMYLIFAWMAQRELVQLRRNDATTSNLRVQD
jgi:O-antigen/teichoic acid export membrane protein